jgi:hypothetical protein
MTQYLISFDDGAMTFPEEELPDVAKAAHEVVQEARNAGVWVSAADWKARGRASSPPTGRSPTARTRRPRRSSADSRSSTCPHVRRHWSGLPRSPSPAAVRKRYGNSCPTRTSDRRRPATVEQDLCWPRSAHRPELGTRGSALGIAWGEARSSCLTGSPQPLIAQWSDSQGKPGG